MNDISNENEEKSQSTAESCGFFGFLRYKPVDMNAQRFGGMFAFYLSLNILVIGLGHLIIVPAYRMGIGFFLLGILSILGTCICFILSACWIYKEGFEAGRKS
jgi:hypothetical protein